MLHTLYLLEMGTSQETKQDHPLSALTPFIYALVYSLVHSSYHALVILQQERRVGNLSIVFTIVLSLIKLKTKISAEGLQLFLEKV